jgi:hypothetical protein
MIRLTKDDLKSSVRIIEALRSKQWRTDPPIGGELGEANALAGIRFPLE